MCSLIAVCRKSPSVVEIGNLNNDQCNLTSRRMCRHLLVTPIDWKHLSASYGKVVAAADGLSGQTHLAAYSRWCWDDVVVDAFAKAEQRPGQGLSAQSSAAYCRTARENLLRPCSSRVSRYSSLVLGGFLRLARCCRMAMQTPSADRGVGRDRERKRRRRR